MVETITAPTNSVLAPRDLDHISYSALKTYASCPRKFAFKYLEQVPEEFKPSSLLFGGAFHSAVEAICEARLRGDAVPELEAIIAAYDDAWRRGSTDANEVRFCKDEDENTLHSLAERMLSVYREFALNEASLAEPSVIVGIEEARRFRLLAEVPPIESRIDLLELQGTDLVVSDLKTSRSKWNDLKVQEATPQLVLYATSLVPLMREMGATRIVPRFIVVTKAKTPIVQVLQPAATQDDVARLKGSVADTWTAIQAGIFVKRQSWECNQCPYRGRCLGR